MQNFKFTILMKLVPILFYFQFILILLQIDIIATENAALTTEELSEIVSSNTTTSVKLSRNKRFVAFPVGSSFSCAICATTGVIGNPNVNYLSMGLNWGFAYDLPNATWVLQHANGFGSKDKKVADAQIKRRHRRELYTRLETLMGRLDTLNKTRTELSSDLNSKWQKILRRPKRYLAFPEGSSFSIAVCFTVGIIGNPRFNYMSFGLNWGVAYDLPNTSWILNHLHGFARHPVPVTILKRRTRRSLYQDIELLIDNMGYNGRECILRTLCESRQYFQRHKMGMIGEILRIVFSLPKQRVFTRELHEFSEINHYDRAYREARSMDCERQYNCHFSLLELALGKYSKAPIDYYSYGKSKM